MTEPENPDPPKKKRWGFKKAAWQVEKEEADTHDIFSHSNEFKDIVAEENRRKQEAKRKKEEEKKRKEDEKREKKRRKVSLELEDGQSLGNTALGDTEEQRIKSQTPVSPFPANKSRSFSAQYDALTHSPQYRKGSGRFPPNSEVINLGSPSRSEGFGANDIKPTITPPSTAPIKTVEDDDDVVEVEPQEVFSVHQATRQDSMIKKDPLDDKIVQLFITSEIPDAKALITTIKTGQPISKARLAWCAYNGYSNERTRDIFFTWKHKKLMDSTTIKRLGIRLDSSGAITVDGTTEIYDDENLPKIHVEAWTDELFAQWKFQEEERKRRRVETPPLVEEPEPEEAVPEKARVRLRLKSKDYPVFNITVYPDTTIEHLASAYRERNSIPNSQPITLMFDGERLRPMDTIADTDVEDMESIEVHMK